MNERWHVPAVKVRRCVWLMELVVVLVLLLVYKFTGNDTVLMTVFLSIIVALVPMSIATMIADAIEVEQLGKD